MVVDSNSIYPHCTAAVYTPDNCLISKSRTHFKPICHQPEKNRLQSNQPNPTKSNPTNQPFQKKAGVFVCSLLVFFFSIFSPCPGFPSLASDVDVKEPRYGSQGVFSLRLKDRNLQAENFESATKWVGEDSM